MRLLEIRDYAGCLAGGCQLIISIEDRIVGVECVAIYSDLIHVIVSSIFEISFKIMNHSISLTLWHSKKKTTIADTNSQKCVE